MIQLPDVALSAIAADGLRSLQAVVDAAGDYPARVAEGKRLFEARNRRGNAIFDEVKRALDRMCSGARRCAYCEDSAADEVEHVRPKDLYPEVVFAWANYVYACGPCNGPKGAHFAVFPANGGEILEVSRAPRSLALPPSDGEPVLIDPRTDDATRFMLLDLRDTFYLLPSAARGTRDHARAEYTIKTLRLNARDVLPRARRQAYEDYVGLLHRYRRERDDGAGEPRLRQLSAGLRARQHPTVWREMLRCRDRLPELRTLFADLPEAADW
ncbi:MAG TPA: hypothetical protein VGC42_04690 [Kofleriaceae bacterium]